MPFRTMSGKYGELVPVFLLVAAVSALLAPSAIQATIITTHPCNGMGRRFCRKAHTFDKECPMPCQPKVNQRTRAQVRCCLSEPGSHYCIAVLNFPFDRTKGKSQIDAILDEMSEYSMSQNTYLGSSTQSCAIS